MNAGQPRAACADSQGHVLSVGTEGMLLHGDKMADAHVNTIYADKVILPGFVEGHNHMMEGLFWNYAYVGYYDREGADGTLAGPQIHRGRNRTAERITSRTRDKTAPLIAGLWPIFSMIVAWIWLIWMRYRPAARLLCCMRACIS